MDLIVWITIGVFIFVIGLLLYLAWKENKNKPNSSREIAKPLGDKEWKQMAKANQ